MNKGSGAPRTAYEHLMEDFARTPQQIARHLREEHGIEPHPAHKGYERTVWHRQHEYETEHASGTSGSSNIGSVQHNTQEVQK